MLQELENSRRISMAVLFSVVGILMLIFFSLEGYVGYKAMHFKGYIQFSPSFWIFGAIGILSLMISFALIPTQIHQFNLDDL